MQSTGHRLAERGWVASGVDGGPPAPAQADEMLRFARHWDDLHLDTFMKDGGTYRYRRYGSFRYRDGDLRRLEHGTYHQSTEVNPLNGGVQRSFEPLTDEFVADPVTRAIVDSIAGVVSACEPDVAEWDVKLHPFRIVTSTEQTGRPAPQGRHRDGCMFVSTVLVDRVNVSGGETSLFDDDGVLLTRQMLSEPGAFITFDDRVVLHDVTDVVPVDPGAPAHRDVLIVDFDRVDPAGDA
jgi:hypothetical protein